MAAMRVMLMRRKRTESVFCRSQPGWSASGTRRTTKKNNQEEQEEQTRKEEREKGRRKEEKELIKLNGEGKGETRRTDYALLPGAKHVERKRHFKGVLLLAQPSSAIGSDRHC